MERRSLRPINVRGVPLGGVFALVLLASHNVAADGWKIQLQGGKNLGASYAGRSALAEDAAAVWFNPAGMTGLPGEWTMTADAPLITYQLDYSDGGSRSVLGQPLFGESSPDGGKTALVPHVYVVRRINDRWRFGFGFNAPYGLGTNYGETWIGRYHATETTLTVFNLNPAIAWQAGKSLSVGFGLDFQRSDATLANMIDFGSIGAAAGLPVAPQRSDGRVEFKGGDWAAGFNAGLRWLPAERTGVGVSYRSNIDHELGGPADFTVPPEVAALTGGGRLFADTNARVLLPMPQELSVSAYQVLDERWTLLADATWTDWSRFKELHVSFDNALQPPVRQAANWRDSIRFAGGAKAEVADRWSLRMGAAYETTPVPDATRTPRLPEKGHFWLSGAGSYSIGDRWSLDVHVSHLITPDAAIVLSDPAAGQLTGSVHWRLSVFGVSATWRLP
jgi:long-chain fatty acid transport protein